MAEVVTSSSSRRLSTRVDMTPMVDLGFLLITFFMLTTTMSKPKTMEINMPDKENGGKMPIKASQTVTVILGKNNKVYLYRGMLQDNPKKETLAYSARSLRQRLLALKEKIGTVHNAKTKKAEYVMVVVIKAEDNANYKNVVDVLDEMNICDIDKYALVDITPAELAYIKRPDK